MIAEYIDWGPFFQTWDLDGPFPRSSPTKSSANRRARCSPKARRCSKRIIAERWLTANAVVAFFPANTVERGHRDLHRRHAPEVAFTWHGLRQQTRSRSSTVCESEQVRWRTSSRRSHRRQASGSDYIGMFAVTSRARRREARSEFAGPHDDYGVIMLKAIADRLAEAFAELLHERVRTRPVGLLRRRVVDQRGADQGEVPRHPPGAGISGLSRTYGQAARCSSS